MLAASCPIRVQAGTRSASAHGGRPRAGRLEVPRHRGDRAAVPGIQADERVGRVERQAAEHAREASGERLGEERAVGVPVEVDLRDAERLQHRRHVLARRGRGEEVRGVDRSAAAVVPALVERCGAFADDALERRRARRSRERLQRGAAQGGRSAGAAVVDREQVPAFEQRPVHRRVSGRRSPRAVEHRFARGIARAALDRDDGPLRRARARRIEMERDPDLRARGGAPVQRHLERPAVGERPLRASHERLRAELQLRAAAPAASGSPPCGRARPRPAERCQHGGCDGQSPPCAGPVACEGPRAPRRPESVRSSHASVPPGPESMPLAAQPPASRRPSSTAATPSTRVPIRFAATRRRSRWRASRSLSRIQVEKVV